MGSVTVRGQFRLIPYDRHGPTHAKYLTQARVYDRQRGDVASSILALFNSALAENNSSAPKAAGLAIDLIQQGEGKDLPVEEALKKAVEKREGSLVV